MSARTSYRSLFAVTGPRFLALSFLARLPAAMAPLGVIMLVVAATGSFAQAGIATATLGIGAAVGGPVLGSLTDRHGQRGLGTIAAIVNAVALVAVVGAVLASAPLAVVAALTAAVGLSTPQIGPLVRVRWAALLRPPKSVAPKTSVDSKTSVATEPASLGTAMSYEGAADEASFVAGPALIGLFAFTGVPALPLLVAAVLSIGAAVPFALHRTAALVPRRRTVERHSVSSGVVAPGSGSIALAAVLIAMTLCVGVVFGATQTGVTSLAQSVGRDGSAGLVYAVLGIGSALAALATAWLPARFKLEWRLPVFAFVLLAGALPLLAVNSLAVAAIAMGVLGLAVAPLLITAYGLAERIAAPGRGGMIMTLLASGTVAGVALGAGLAGQLVGPYGHAGALLVPLGAGVLAVLVALVGIAVQARGTDRPTVAPVAYVEREPVGAGAPR